VSWTSPDNAPLLEAQGLGRRDPAGAGWLLDDVDLQVRTGDRVAIVGPSGAGKTLLLRALALLDPVDKGRILSEGRPVSGDAVPRCRSRVTYLHQRPVLFGPAVEDDLRRPFGLAVHRASSYDEEGALELLDAVGREPSFLVRRSDELSGGEAQIAALVRLLLLRPRLLLLDEPTSALDPETVQAVLDLLATWLDRRPEAAMVWVGHDREQTSRMTDRRLAVRDGRLEGAG